MQFTNSFDTIPYDRYSEQDLIHEYHYVAYSAFSYLDVLFVSKARVFKIIIAHGE